MDEFFKVWRRAKKKYRLERLVKINFEEALIRIYFEEALIRIYFEDKIIVRVDGEYTDREILYTQAAQRLLAWMQHKEQA